MEPSVSNTELVPMRKEPFLPTIKTEKQPRRAPSYSDSFIVLHSLNLSSKKNDKGSGVFEYLDLASASSSSQLAVIESRTEEESKKRWIFVIAEKSVSVVFHIFLISIFESVFFRLFITKSEDKGILTTVQRLIGGVTNTCQTWNTNQTALLNDVLTLFVNVSQVEYQASHTFTTRSNYNKAIFTRSWIYVGALGSLMVVLALVSIWRKWIQRIHIRQILLENIGLVAMLGLYEYMFFRTVIYDYDSISVQEIEGNILQTLQGQCGLFQ